MTIAIHFFLPNLYMEYRIIQRDVHIDIKVIAGKMKTIKVR